MSIILDALKRSDRERRLQKPPDLSQIYQENHPPRKKVLVWVVLISVVMIAGLSGAYLLFQKDSRPEKIKPSDKVVVDAGKKTQASGKPKKIRNFSKNPEKKDAVQKQNSSGIVSQRRALRGSTRGRSRAHGDDPRTMETVQSDSEDTSGGNPLAAILGRATRAREEMAESDKMGLGGGAHPLAALFSKPDGSRDETARTETPVRSTAKPELPAPNPEVDAPVPAKEQTASLSRPRGVSIVEPEATQVEKSEPVSENQVQEEAGEQDNIPEPSAPIKGNAAVVSAGEKIPLVDDLPYETRQKYEDLQINVHIYDNKPGERRVFINMHSYKEGEKIGEGGPLLVAIIPEGVIVDYGEGKVQMNVEN